MRKKIVRVIAVLLTLVIMAGSIAGCGSKNAADSEERARSTKSEGKNRNNSMTAEETGEAPSAADYYPSDSAAESAVSSSNAGYDGGFYEEEYANTEEYGIINESGFMSAKGSPLSTFAADVDTASYSNIRRMIYDGYGIESIPNDAVRIEEMLNYFSYDYSQPIKGEPFGVTTEISTCPWNEDNELLMVGLQTRAIDFSESSSSNLVFLLDVSGSMYSDDKLPLLQKSFSMLAENLTAKDRISIVTYAGSDEILIQGVKGNDKETILEAINSLTAGGSTAGSAGIKTAYELAEEYFIEGGNNRVILATDGDLNVGLTTEKELEDLITRQKKSGVFLSVLGFGTGNLKDNKMEILADKGNGQYAYIDSTLEAKKVLVEEMGATLVTVAKDVKFQIEFNPEVVEGYRLIGYENRAMANQDFADDSKDGGEIGAGHSVTVLYEIIKADGASKRSKDPWMTLHIRYKEPDGDESKLLSYPIDRESYTELPSEEWLFAGAVAEFGLVLKESEYKGDASLEHVTDTLTDISLRGDEYKKELYNLVMILDGRVVICN